MLYLFLKKKRSFSSLLPIIWNPFQKSKMATRRQLGNQQLTRCCRSEAAPGAYDSAYSGAGFIQNMCDVLE